ncbi:MAG: hypothetical protein ACYC4L_17205 [Chloroflexota bacterium]
MSIRNDILARFAGEGGAGVLWLPDLTVWYGWQRGHLALPEEWRDLSLPAVARALGVPCWAVARPWRLEQPGIEVRREEGEAERTLTYVTPAGTLRARWARGADGGWWQTEYPVRSEADLPAARALLAARRYHLDPAPVARLLEEVGEDGVVALELPARPYSEMFQSLLGWSEGLLLLYGEAGTALLELLGPQEEQVDALVAAIARLPGDLALAPENLDGQFLAPSAFGQHLAPGLGRAAGLLAAAGKPLVVHGGGSLRRLLAPLAQTGARAVEGVAGPPQSDATLAEARALAGPELVLWGGIPQDLLLPAVAPADFESGVRAALADCRADPRAILGVADRVPEQASLDRLRRIGELVT